MILDGETVIVTGVGLGRECVKAALREGADVVAFFASDLAKAVTGQHLLVSAGEMSR